MPDDAAPSHEAAASSMESAASLRSCYGSLGNFTHVQSLLDRPGGLPFCSASSNKPLFSQSWTFGGRLVSAVNRKAILVPYVKASGLPILETSDVVHSNSSSQGSSQKNVLQGASFPNGFEALVQEVCDETDVAELKLKVGDFEMHLKRNIEATKIPSLITTPSPMAAVVSTGSPISISGPRLSAD
ncbi:uncharacterized protein LOC122650547 [Telopea speciosissima]|uniref:uncharacterized protein LOC122650547 n=1 Tax=Telopea speciosissima TaxID=54955 RepID=UPI001CC681D0|nr:uncharacterized protein LOC122650547 [Telopea speciosissima]